MKILKAIFTTLATMIAGMYGGQKNKGVRRFGIAGLAVAMDFKRGWPMLFLIPVLIMGYGEKSILMGWIGNEILVRVAYAILLGLPFMFYGFKRGFVAVGALVIAFQVQAGSLGYISWFGDILVEDICRYGTLGVLIAFNLFLQGGNRE